MPQNNNEQPKSNPTPEEQLRHDEYLEEMGASRVAKAHGGELVEAISLDDLVTTNDPSTCEHEWEHDPTEKLGIAVRCVKPKCGIVKIANNSNEE